MASPVPASSVSLRGLCARLPVATARRMQPAAAAAAAAAADRTVAPNHCCSWCGVRPPRHLQRMPSRGFAAHRLLHAHYAGELGAAAAAKAARLRTAAVTATPPGERLCLPPSLVLLLQRPVLLQQRRQLQRSNYLLHPAKQHHQQQRDAAEAAPGAAVSGVVAAKNTVKEASVAMCSLPSEGSQAPLQLGAAFAPQPPRRAFEERRRWSPWWKVCLFVLGIASPFAAAAAAFRALLHQREQQHEVAQLAAADVEEALKAAQRRFLLTLLCHSCCCCTAQVLLLVVLVSFPYPPPAPAAAAASSPKTFRVVVGGSTCILFCASESDKRILAGRVDPHLPETRVLRLPKEEVITGIPNNALTHLIAGRRSPVALPFNFVHFPLSASTAVARQVKEGHNLLLALLYVDPHSGDSVMLSGVAAAVDAVAYKSYYWKTSWGALFPGGSVSADYELIKFVPSSISIDLSAAGAPIRLFRVVNEDSIFWAFEGACSDGSKQAGGEQRQLTAAAAAASS
ncbi:hypothetical protein Esti_006409 [Eimeria stiedai]